MRRSRSLLFAVFSSLLVAYCCAMVSPAQEGGMQRSVFHVQEDKLPKRPPVKTDLRFEDITASTGIHYVHDSSPDAKYIMESMSGGLALIDYDRDGWPDIFFTGALTVQEALAGKKAQSALYHNNHDGTFTDVTEKAGVANPCWANGAVVGDYNNDGWPDMLVTCFGGVVLYRNNGDGTFTDVTKEAGLGGDHMWAAGASFGDYDGDGWADLFVDHYVDLNLQDLPKFGSEKTCKFRGIDVQCGPAGLPGSPDNLYHNNHDGTFTECAQACGLRVAAFVKGVACADYDNDGRPDLYLSVRGGPNLLLHNDGPDAGGHWHFSDVTAKAGPVQNPRLSFGTFFFDYDNDGWEDLLVFGYDLPHGVMDVVADYLGLPNAGAKPKLYHNNRDGTFSDVTAEMHLNRICHTMGHNYGDLDNDGWLDFYCGTGDPDFRTLIPKRMFRNAEGHGFQDVTTATGTGHLQKGHGVAFADFNDDGAQDVFIVFGGAYTGDIGRSALFLNPGTTNHWLKLKLVGTKANRAAIGARLQVSLRTPAGPRELYRTVSSGGSLGCNPLRQEIGLGKATAITAVRIRWPGSDTRQILRGLELDQSYLVREGDPAPVRLRLHPVALGPGPVSPPTPARLATQQ